MFFGVLKRDWLTVRRTCFRGRAKI